MLPFILALVSASGWSKRRSGKIILHRGPSQLPRWHHRSRLHRLEERHRLDSLERWPRKWAGHGVNVNAIAPGLHGHRQHGSFLLGPLDPIRSRTIRKQGLRQVVSGGKAEDAAGVVVFLASSYVDYIHGAV